MKVLKFQKNKIYLENEEVIDINRDIKAKYSIKTNCEISFDTYKSIIYDSALSKSFFLLSMRDYTNRDLFQKLSGKYKRSSVVSKELYSVIEKLCELGYIDDYSYTKSYIQRKANLGKSRIKYELSLKGINSTIIEEVYNEEEQGETEIEKMEKLLPKIIKKDKQKQVAYLMRRGFNLGDILEVLKDLEG